jgi:hypothetical protein
VLSLCPGIFFPFTSIDTLAGWTMGDTGVEVTVGGIACVDASHPIYSGTP